MRFTIALLSALVSLSYIDAKSVKREKKPSDDFDIGNLQNSDWSLEPQPASSNVVDSEAIREALQQYLANRGNQDNSLQQQDQFERIQNLPQAPTNSFTLSPPGFDVQPNQQSNQQLSNAQFFQQNQQFFPNQQFQSVNQFNAQPLNAAPQLTPAFSSEFVPTQNQQQFNPAQVNSAPQQFKPAQQQFSSAPQQFVPTTQQVNSAPQQFIPAQQFSSAPQQFVPTTQQVNSAQKPFIPSQQQFDEAQKQFTSAQQQLISNQEISTPQQQFVPSQQQFNLPQQSPVKSTSLESPQVEDAAPVTPIIAQDLPDTIPLAQFLEFLKTKQSVPTITAKQGETMEMAPVIQENNKPMPNDSHDNGNGDDNGDGDSMDGSKDMPPAPEAPPKVDPHHDMSYLLTDNDDYKIARDANGNAILLSMVDNRGEIPANMDYSPFSFVSAHPIESQYSAESKNKDYVVPFVNNGKFQNDTLSVNPSATSATNQVLLYQNYPEETTPSRNNFLSRRPPFATDFSPTRLSQNHFLVSGPPSSLVSGQQGPEHLDDILRDFESTTSVERFTNLPQNSPTQNHFLSERPPTSASPFPSTLSEQNGPISTQGSHTVEFLSARDREPSTFSHYQSFTPTSTTVKSSSQNPQTSPIQISSHYPQTSPAEISSQYTQTTPIQLSSEYHQSTPIQMSSQYPQTTPIAEILSSQYITNNPHSSTESFIARNSPENTPFRVTPTSYNRQEEGGETKLTTPETTDTTYYKSTTSNSRKKKPSTSTTETLKTTTLPETTTLIYIPETTLNTYSTTPLTVNDETEAQLPPYNPYPNNPPPQSYPPQESGNPYYSSASDNYDTPVNPNTKPVSIPNYSNSWLANNYLAKPHYPIEFYNDYKKPNVENSVKPVNIKPISSNYQTPIESYPSNPTNSYGQPLNSDSVKYSAQFSVSSNPAPNRRPVNLHDNNYHREDYHQFRPSNGYNAYQQQGVGETQPHTTTPTPVKLPPTPAPAPITQSDENKENLSSENSYDEIPKLPLYAGQEVVNVRPVNSGHNYLSKPSSSYPAQFSNDQSNYPSAQYNYPSSQGVKQPQGTVDRQDDPPDDGDNNPDGDDNLEAVYLPADNCSSTFVVREDRQSVLGVRALPGGATVCSLTFLSPSPDKRLALQLLGLKSTDSQPDGSPCKSASVSVFSQRDGRNLLMKEFCSDSAPSSPALLTEGNSALVTVRAEAGAKRAGFTVLAFLW